MSKMKRTDSIQKECKFWNLQTLTTSILDNWMEKVGRTSKSDVKQKEKKP
tara:strand:- start:633 stop:782 length:150 start_codon:yes stop_codon:yes gene_type:complete